MQNLNKMMRDAAMKDAAVHDTHVKTALLAALLKEVERRNGGTHFVLTVDMDSLNVLHQQILDGEQILKLRQDDETGQINLELV